MLKRRGHHRRNNAQSTEWPSYVVQIWNSPQLTSGSSQDGAYGFEHSSSPNFSNVDQVAPVVESDALEGRGQSNMLIGLGFDMGMDASSVPLSASSSEEDIYASDDVGESLSKQPELQAKEIGQFARVTKSARVTIRNAARATPSKASLHVLKRQLSISINNSTLSTTVASASKAVSASHTSAGSSSPLLSATSSPTIPTSPTFDAPGSFSPSPSSVSDFPIASPNVSSEASVHAGHLLATILGVGLGAVGFLAILIVFCFYARRKGILWFRRSDRSSAYDDFVEEDRTWSRQEVRNSLQRSNTNMSEKYSIRDSTGVARHGRDSVVNKVAPMLPPIDACVPLESEASFTDHRKEMMRRKASIASRTSLESVVDSIFSDDTVQQSSQTSHSGCTAHSRKPAADYSVERRYYQQDVAPNPTPNNSDLINTRSADPGMVKQPFRPLRMRGTGRISNTNMYRKGAEVTDQTPTEIFQSLKSNVRRTELEDRFTRNDWQSFSSKVKRIDANGRPIRPASHEVGKVKSKVTEARVAISTSWTTPAILITDHPSALIPPSPPQSPSNSRRRNGTTASLPARLAEVGTVDITEVESDYSDMSSPSLKSNAMTPISSSSSDAPSSAMIVYESDLGNPSTQSCISNSDSSKTVKESDFLVKELQQFIESVRSTDPIEEVSLPLNGDRSVAPSTTAPVRPPRSARRGISSHVNLQVTSRSNNDDVSRQEDFWRSRSSKSHVDIDLARLSLSCISKNPVTPRTTTTSSSTMMVSCTTISSMSTCRSMSSNASLQDLGSVQFACTESVETSQVDVLTLSKAMAQVRAATTSSSNSTSSSHLSPCSSLLGSSPFPPYLLGPNMLRSESDYSVYSE